ncbi:hypothetical protein GGR51DRAFT_354595 [Nemania sp. FL0031]|nr:hypothetical protein GGR51DRAFT_354595 [Nemania sp. FL0031]
MAMLLTNRLYLLRPLWLLWTMNWIQTKSSRVTSMIAVTILTDYHDPGYLDRTACLCPRATEQRRLFLYGHQVRGSSSQGSLCVNKYSGPTYTLPCVPKNL